MKFCTVIITKAIGFAQGIVDAVSDSYFWAKAFLLAWKHDLRIIWMGYSIDQTWEMITLSFGSIIVSAVAAKRRLTSHRNERTNMRNCNAEFNICNSVFDWSRSLQWSIAHV